jgi:cobalt-precorrin-5B (C1)-methyltransferase
MGSYRDQVPPRDRHGMRTGFTTGTTAAAAARAATIALLSGRWPAQVPVSLPVGGSTSMTPLETRLADGQAFCCALKDGGDDPDVTHGALICATVRHGALPGISIEGGSGVGRVTLPGLGLPVGTAAINPMPRKQIAANVEAAIGDIVGDGEAFLANHGIEVVITVPEGERLAQQTLNPRLGILGGISILGTSGIVYPYSTAAWRASVIKAVDVAAYHSPERVVLATGARSEQYAMRLFPELPEPAFVEISVFTGAAMRACVAHSVHAIVLVAMISRIVKTAQGCMNTHVAGNPVDIGFLAQVCREAGAADDLCTAVATANTARHMLELCRQWPDMRPVERLMQLALEQSHRFVRRYNGPPPALEVILVDFDGAVLSRRRDAI